MSWLTMSDNPVQSDECDSDLSKHHADLENDNSILSRVEETDSETVLKTLALQGETD